MLKKLKLKIIQLIDIFTDSKEIKERKEIIKKLQLEKKELELRNTIKHLKIKEDKKIINDRQVSYTRSF